MMIERLTELEEQGKQIKVGIVGTGFLGSGIVHQIYQMKGMSASVLADINIEAAIKAYLKNKVDRSQVVIAENVRTAKDAVYRGKPVVTEDPEIIPETGVDVIVEATGVPEIGAKIALKSILNRKHIVMMNVEADVVIGPILSKFAKSCGVVYTIAAGDQPGVICEMYDWAISLGLKVVVAGRGTVLPPGGRKLTPEEVKDEARKFGLSPKMLTSFKDGTKSQIEMAGVANMIGFLPDVRGMHEPFASVDELVNVFALQEQGGILERERVIESANCYTPEGKYVVQGQVFPGVFLIVTTEHPGIINSLNYHWSTRGYTGPNYPLYRPYHLCAIEVPRSIAKAYLYHEAIGAAQKIWAEAITLAKKELKKGEILDGAGGATVYGLVEKAQIAKQERLLPIGFANGGRLKVDVSEDEPITWDMVEVDTDSFLFKLRKLQDEERLLD